MTALALVAAHPGDVTTLAAHEPPFIAVLPAAGRRTGAERDHGGKSWSAGMAAFVGMTAWHGEFTDAHFAQPALDPAAFGMWAMVMEGETTITCT